jgi:hypothetical protein
MDIKSKYYKKLSTLRSDELLTILHDCVDILAPVSPSEMATFDGISKKQVFNRMNENKYMIFIFDGRKYPIINWHLNLKTT